MILTRRLLCIALLAPAADLYAQALTSPKNVIMAHSMGHGGTTASTKYELVATFGQGVVAQRIATSKFVIHGGFNAAIEVSTTGSPVLSAVLPRYATLRGQESLTLYGTEFDIGPNPTIKIGGQTAILGARLKDRITTVLPIQPAPGWQPVEISNSSGTTVLVKGVGVLPMIESQPAAASDVPFALVFRGTKGDRVCWSIALGQSSVPLRIPGIHYGFALSPSLFVVFCGYGITNASGELRLPFPATTYVTGSVYAQAMLTSTNPGYRPASFTNVIRL